MQGMHTTLTQEVGWAALHRKGDSMSVTVYKLSMAVTVYHPRMDGKKLLKGTLEVVLITRHIKKTDQNRLLRIKWNISPQAFSAG